MAAARSSPTPPAETWGAIQRLLDDLARAFDGLRAENEQLRERLQLATEDTVFAFSPDASPYLTTLMTPVWSERVEQVYSERVAVPEEGPAAQRVGMAMGPCAVAAHVAKPGGDTVGLGCSGDAGMQSDTKRKTVASLIAAREEALSARRPGEGVPVATATESEDIDADARLAMPPELQLDPYNQHGTLLRVWDNEEDTLCSRISERTHRSDSFNLKSFGVAKVGDVLETRGPLRHIMVSPNGYSPLVWDFFSIVMLSVDMFMSPLLVFEIVIPEKFVLFSAVFWTLDIWQQCRVGFFVQGRLELRPRVVVCRYLKSTFAFDLCMISLDWITVYESGSAALGKMLRVRRGVHVIRLLRMVRLLRVIKIMLKFEPPSFGRSFTVITGLKVLKKILFIVVINHFVACAWYGISMVSDSLGGTRAWAMALPSDHMDDLEPSIVFKYCTALHWALTQFTPASMEVHPMNAPERVFTIIVMIFSLLAFSSVVASMTSIMTQLMNKNAEHTTEKELLTRFINEHRVSVDLSTRIVSFVDRERVRLERRPVLESQVPLLKKLPDALKKELHREVFTNVLLRHPLFLELDTRDGPNLEELCHKAMEDELFSIREAIWTVGEVAKKMFFVIRGGLHSFACEFAVASQLPPLLSVDARAGDMLSEHALWLNWCYSSEMVSLSDVACFTLDSAKFARIARRSGASSLLFAYAKVFQQRGPTESDLPHGWHSANELLLEAKVQDAEPNGPTEWSRSTSGHCVFGKILQGVGLSPR